MELAADPGASMTVTAPSHALVATSRDVLARHARSFRWAGALLPADRLDDAAVVYAFCRLVDDLADEAPDPVTAHRDLTEVRAELHDQRQPRDLIVATREVFAAGGQDIGPAEHLLEGVLSDLEPVKVASDDELHRYCYQVAGTVGLMMCAVLRVADPSALPFAVDLGVGMQITNICRDVLEDAERGRVYLPAARLDAAGVPPERLLQAAADGPPLDAAEREGLSIVVRDLLDQADRYYASGGSGMRYIPWRARLAIRVASRVYRAIGIRLRRRGSDPWVGRTMIGAVGKVGWTLVALADEVGGWFARKNPHEAALHEHLLGLPGCER